MRWGHMTSITNEMRSHDRRLFDQQMARKWHLCNSTKVVTLLRLLLLTRRYALYITKNYLALRSHVLESLAAFRPNTNKNIAYNYFSLTRSKTKKTKLAQLFGFIGTWRWGGHCQLARITSAPTVCFWRCMYGSSKALKGFRAFEKTTPQMLRCLVSHQLTHTCVYIHWARYHNM